MFLYWRALLPSSLYNLFYKVPAEIASLGKKLVSRAKRPGPLISPKIRSLQFLSSEPSVIRSPGLSIQKMPTCNETARCRENQFSVHPALRTPFESTWPILDSFDEVDEATLKAFWPSRTWRVFHRNCVKHQTLKVCWPCPLSKLASKKPHRLGGSFDESLDNATWPADLQSLTFGHSQPLRALIEIPTKHQTSKTYEPLSTLWLKLRPKSKLCGPGILTRWSRS